MERVKDRDELKLGDGKTTIRQDIRGIKIERKIFGGLGIRWIVIYEGCVEHEPRLALFAVSNSLWKRRYRRPLRVEEILAGLSNEKPGWFINALGIIERLLSYQSFSEIRERIDRVTEISRIDILRIANLLFSRMFIKFPRRHRTLSLKQIFITRNKNKKLKGSAKIGARFFYL